MVVIDDSKMIIKDIEVKSEPQTLPFPTKKRRVGFSHQNPLEVVVGSPKRKDLTESVSSGSSTSLQGISRKKSVSLQELPDHKPMTREETKLLLKKLRGQLSLRSDQDLDSGTSCSPRINQRQRLRSGSLKNQYSLERVKITEARTVLTGGLNSKQREGPDEPDFFELDFSKSLEKRDSVKSVRIFECRNSWKQRTDTVTSTCTTISNDSEGSAQSSLSFSNNTSSTLDRRSLSSRRGSSKSPCPQNFIPGENKGRKFVNPLNFFRKTSVCFHGVSIKINRDAPRTSRAIVYAGILGLVVPSPSKHGCKNL